VPRLELFHPGIPDRPGINPFTRQPIIIRGRPEKRLAFEVELRGEAVETCTLYPGQEPRRATVRYATAEQAETAFVHRVRKMRAAGYREVGPSQVLASPQRGSTLLLDELLAAGDGARFLDEVLACTSDRKLAELAGPWARDARPEMRRALLAYVDDGCDRYHHKPLVKHLFKHAEQFGDDEAMAHFMVAFDRLAHRYAVTRWEWRTRTNRTTLVSDPLARERLDGERDAAPRFTRATRRYLARRAFRYFRRLGRTDPARYAAATRLALPLYEDRHLASPARLLDAWSLLHTLYAWSPVLERDPRGVRVAAGRSLAELEPAPYFPATLRGCDAALLDMLVAARSRTVRKWTIGWLEAHGALDGLPVARVRPLLASADDEVAAFGARLFARSRELDALPVEEWLALLAIESVDAVCVVVDAFEKHVAPKRVTLAQCAELATARVAAVAELGLRWARERAIAAAADLGQIARVAQSPVEHVRAEGTRWLLRLLEAGAPGRAERLRDLFDSRFTDVRALAIEHVDKTGGVELPLWLALLESPYDDVRALVVRNAEAWQGEAGADDVRLLASTVVLAVHRGGATKQTMLRRIAERAAERPEEADRLLPVLALALRSVRAPERTGALLALARAAVASEALRAAVAAHFPEIVIDARISA
jgi:hypothetical protein